jgi:hypothetical protein
VRGSHATRRGLPEAGSPRPGWPLSYGEENYHVFLYEVRDFVEAHNRVADVDSYLSIVDFWMAPMQLIDDVSQLFELHFSFLLQRRGSLILRRLFDFVNHKHVGLRPGRFQLQSQLLLNGREQVRLRFGSLQFGSIDCSVGSRCGIWRSQLTVLFGARAVRILQDFAGICRANSFILFVCNRRFRTHNP